MEKLAVKVPLLIFFLGVIYFASNGFDVIDALIRSFMLAFGIALVILALMLVFMFLLTLQKNRSEDRKPLGGEGAEKKVELQV